MAALKSDTLSLASEVGLSVGGLTYFVFFPGPHLNLKPDQPAYWLPKQIGMTIGFLRARA